jgi:chromosome segregation ATPase
MSSAKRKQERQRKAFAQARRDSAAASKDAKRIETLEARWREYLEQIQEQNTRINELEAKLQKRKTTIGTAQERLNQLADENACQTQLIATLRSELAQKDADMEALGAECNKAKRELANIKGRIAEQNTQLSRLERAVNADW